jgi:hypothetical protein
VSSLYDKIEKYWKGRAMDGDWSPDMLEDHSWHQETPPDEGPHWFALINLHGVSESEPSSREYRHWHCVFLDSAPEVREHDFAILHAEFTSHSRNTVTAYLVDDSRWHIQQDVEELAQAVAVPVERLEFHMSFSEFAHNHLLTAGKPRDFPAREQILARLYSDVEF